MTSLISFAISGKISFSTTVQTTFQIYWNQILLQSYKYNAIDTAPYTTLDTIYLDDHCLGEERKRQNVKTYKIL